MLLRVEELAPSGDLSVARGLLAKWNAPSAEQARERDRIVAWIDRYPHDAHLRTRLEGHLTASALVVDHERECALLTHHKKLGRWLQLGGHCDGDANLVHVALREALEESGIAGLSIEDVPIDVDVHVIPRRGDEPEHLHLDTRFVVFAPPGARAIASEESNEVRWVKAGEIDGIETDESVRRLFRVVFGMG